MNVASAHCSLLVLSDVIMLYFPSVVLCMWCCFRIWCPPPLPLPPAPPFYLFARCFGSNCVVGITSYTRLLME